MLVQQTDSVIHIHVSILLMALAVKKTRLPVQEMQEMLVSSLGQEDPLEEGMATHPSILAWKIPGTEKSVRLQSTGLERVRHV